LEEFGGPAENQLNKVIVQPSRRIFGEREYEEAGATVCEDVEEADILLGVKVRNSLYCCLPAVVE
jgi:hypothetical protein